jgi:hypothetical protein
MMKKKAYLLVSVLLMNVLSGCKDDIEENEAVDSVKQESVEDLNLRALYSENHVISVSEASEIALKAPEIFAGEFTRAGDQTPRVIESVGVYAELILLSDQRIRMKTHWCMSLILKITEDSLLSLRMIVSRHNF